MATQLPLVLGGLGLFLLGMLVLTDGLRAIAGDSVQRLLLRFTRTPWSGAATGAALTAVLQSSSVMTVTTVAFVGSGLMTFAQALGVMFGANIGTTLKGWLVALLGMELEVSRFAMPLLFAGVLVRFFARGKLRDAGWALAGFALLFLGLEAMQTALGALGDRLTPADFPPDTVTGRLLLIGMGAVMTLVTQSSSAGVAMALAAVGAGTLEFTQAAAMVIGMDVGTTSTTALATIGGSPQTRRTGYAHVVYNLMTGVGAFLLLDPFVTLLGILDGGLISRAPHIALVAFHTTFNTLGVLAVLPLTGRFARLMTRVIPESAPDPLRRLEPTLLGDPDAAALALVGTLEEVTRDLTVGLTRALEVRSRPTLDHDLLDRLQRAVHGARSYADRVMPAQLREETSHQLVGLLHALDHLDQLADAAGRSDRIAALHRDLGLMQVAAPVRAALESLGAQAGEAPAAAAAALARARSTLAEEREPLRRELLARVPVGQLTLEEALHRLDALRWLGAVTYDAWRVAHHLAAIRDPELRESPEQTLRAEGEAEL
jgi:phosphate:Na+ symporter